MATSATITAQQQLELTAFSTALASYRAQRWQIAIAQFDQLQQMLPESARRDSLYSVYLERMVYLEQNNLQQHWDTIFVFDRK